MVTRWLGITTVPAGDLQKRKLAMDDRVKGALSGRGESLSVPTDKSPYDRNSVTIQASIESENRAGDVIRAEGWELENYRLNPVILWAHRHDLLPVGKSVDVWVENGALMATIEFAPTDFAQQVGLMFEKGFLRGVSVGFRPLKTSPRSGGGRRGTVFERQELLEISAAPVPMHPFALAAGRAEAALGRRARRLAPGVRGELGSSGNSAGLARAGAAEADEPLADTSQERDLVPLFRELAEMWQSVAGVSPSG